MRKKTYWSDDENYTFYNVGEGDFSLESKKDKIALLATPWWGSGAHYQKYGIFKVKLLKLGRLSHAYQKDLVATASNPKVAERRMLKYFKLDK